MFLGSISPSLNFAEIKIGCKSMLHNDWLDIPYISHSFDLFAPNLERLVTRIPEGIFSQL
jgi:hypothetical protein